MRTVILAGGFGTRLSEETSVIPKPLVQINGKPLIIYIMEHYAMYGFNDFIIATGYKGDKIKEYFDNPKPANNFKVSVLDTGLNTMTGGRIKRIVESGLIDGTFMLTYGDGVSDVNLKQLLEFHKSHGKTATITGVRMPRFGIVNIAESGKVTSFQEKRIENSPFINGGFMVLEKKVAKYIENDSTPFETTPMQKLVQDGELYAFRHDGFWKCVDSLRDKQELEEIVKKW